MSLYEHCIRYYSRNKRSLDRSKFDLPQEILIDIIKYDPYIEMSAEILRPLCDKYFRGTILVYEKMRTSRLNYLLFAKGPCVYYNHDNFRVRIYNSIRINGRKVYGDFLKLKVFLSDITATKHAY